MFDSIAWTLGLDEFSVIQILTLSGVCGFIVSQMVQGWIASVSCNIGLFGSAVGTNLVCRNFGVVVTHNKDLDGIIFTTIGLTGAAIGVLLVVLLFSAVNDRIGVSARKLREQTEAAKTTT